MTLSSQYSKGFTMECFLMIRIWIFRKEHIRQDSTNVSRSCWDSGEPSLSPLSAKRILDDKIIDMLVVNDLGTISNYKDSVVDLQAWLAYINQTRLVVLEVFWAASNWCYNRSVMQSFFDFEKFRKNSLKAFKLNKVSLSRFTIVCFHILAFFFNSFEWVWSLFKDWVFSSIC